MDTAPPEMAATPFRLFDLPQELQDIIFDLAWPSPKNVRLYFGVQHVCGLSPHGPFSSYQVPIPKPPVESWLVFRRFFTASAKAYMASYTIGVMDHVIYHQVGFFEHFTRRKCGLVLDFATHVVVGAPNCGKPSDETIAAVAKRCPRLRALTLEVSDQFFALKEFGKWVGIHEHDEDDFEYVFDNMELARLCGLQKLELCSPRTMFAMREKPDFLCAM